MENFPICGAVTVQNDLPLFCISAAAADKAFTINLPETATALI